MLILRIVCAENEKRTILKDIHLWNRSFLLCKLCSSNRFAVCFDAIACVVLETEITFAVVNILQALYDNFSHFFVWYVDKLTID